MKSLLIAIVWFSFVAGLAEGIGLMAFQRINWARWGPMIHVSPPVLWVSPLVDLILFSVFGLAAGLAAYLSKRASALATTVLVLTFLTVYDWSALTARLYYWSCALLA